MVYYLHVHLFKSKRYFVKRFHNTTVKTGEYESFPYAMLLEHGITAIFDYISSFFFTSPVRSLICTTDNWS